MPLRFVPLVVALIGLGVSLVVHVAVWLGLQPHSSRVFAVTVTLVAMAVVCAAWLVNGVVGLDAVWRRARSSVAGRLIGILCVYGFAILAFATWQIGDATDRPQDRSRVTMSVSREADRLRANERERYLGLMLSGAWLGFFSAAAVLLMTSNEAD